MRKKRKNILFWEEHDGELRRLAEEEKLTSRQVSEILGVSRDAVTGRAKRIGVKWHLKPLFWELKQQKKLANIVNERKAAKQKLAPEKDYWAARHGWSFPASGHCVFPKGDVRNSNLSFCGEPVIREGKSYCQAHEKIAYYRTSRGVD
jgi:GcrA cell cycle regulator